MPRDNPMELVSVKQLAREIGLDRSNTLKAIKKMGITPRRLRLPDTRGQFASVVTLGEAQAFLRRRREEGHIDGPASALLAEAGPIPSEDDCRLGADVRSEDLARVIDAATQVGLKLDDFVRMAVLREVRRIENDKN